ncbi:MAG: hypothetical protein MRJ96_10720 [Nitrospirales bacterium]|nr:hypothetical protein [Nitrospira sp.]MDR4501911.1 hypothetical protein [Nitrospirales bacterium]
MPITVRRADIRVERDLLIDLQRRYLAPDADTVRFDWLYGKNPFGEPHVLVAQDSETSDIIGMAAAFPRSLCMGTQKRMGWVLGDFCLGEQYRSLGPAIQLQKACLEGLGPKDSAIWYDFPSNSMLAIYKRLKAPPCQKMIRFVKLLKVDRKVQTWTRSRLLQHGLCTVGNAVLNLIPRRRRIPLDFSVQCHEGACGNEFHELCSEIWSQSGSCLERTAPYLNWRYLQNPLYHSEILTIRKGGALKGYVVLAEMGSETTIMDLFSVTRQDVVQSLLQGVVDRARSLKSEAVVASLIEGHPWISSLQALGFIPRETSPVIINGLPSMSEQPSNSDRWASFLLMQGDRDS